jgi:hypothetical protein
MVRFGILGPVEIHRDGHRVASAGRRQVGLLAFLLLHANRGASTDGRPAGMSGSGVPQAADTASACPTANRWSSAAVIGLAKR